MKFTVTMKDPDTLHDAIEDACNSSVGDMDIPDDEKKPIAELRIEKVSDLCGKWFEYGEYLTVEIDTEKQTCEVVEKKR